jgi:hypothetical protein
MREQVFPANGRDKSAKAAFSFMWIASFRKPRLN